MFAVVVSGRPVLASPEIVSPTQCAFNIPSQPPFSYIVVFILPDQQLPENTAAAVYAKLPPSNDFNLLGALNPHKPSAIFRVREGAISGGGGTGQPGGGDDMMVDDAALKPDSTSADGSATSNVVIGISVEPTANIEQQLVALKQPRQTSASTGQELVRHQPQPASNRVSTQLLPQRIIENAFNYLSSFAEGSAGRETIPLKRFQDWWDKFRKRLEMDASFLEKADQG